MPTESPSKEPLARKGIGIVDRALAYLVGRYGVGWVCDECDRPFHHHGRPRRTFLAFVDHAALDHHRLPRRWSRARMLVPVTPQLKTLTSGTAATTLRWEWAVVGGPQSKTAWVSGVSTMRISGSNSNGR